jgi:hypothetical protein
MVRLLLHFGRCGVEFKYQKLEELEASYGERSLKSVPHFSPTIEASRGRRRLAFRLKTLARPVEIDLDMVLRRFLDKEKMDQRSQRNVGGSCDEFPILVTFEADILRGCQRDRD